MLRVETETGWWLVTHPDHARLAGAIATRWGNSLFAPPEPRDRVLLGIHTHDDCWAHRDAHPSITKQGKPSAFSVELVGQHSAFEEIDLEDYLAVRECAVTAVAGQDAFAALLVSMHTCNLLTARTDRSTIAPAQVPLLDAFLKRQRVLQQSLRTAVRADPQLTADETGDTNFQDGFRLLQATDNLSLLGCVGYTAPATLLHPLRLRNGCQSEVAVTPLGDRRFRLAPYPLDAEEVRIPFPARFIPGKQFASSAELEAGFTAAKVQELELVLVSEGLS
jgi:hypothetical protein